MSIRRDLFKSSPRPEVIPKYIDPEFIKGSNGELLEGLIGTGLGWRPDSTTPGDYKRGVEWNALGYRVQLMQTATTVKSKRILRRSGSSLDHSFFKVNFFDEGENVVTYQLGDGKGDYVLCHENFASNNEYTYADERQKMVLEVALLIGKFTGRSIVFDRPPIKSID